jgi:hypothetical protein
MEEENSEENSEIEDDDRVAILEDEPNDEPYNYEDDNNEDDNENIPPNFFNKGMGLPSRLNIPLNLDEYMSNENVKYSKKYLKDYDTDSAFKRQEMILKETQDQSDKANELKKIWESISSNNKLDTSKLKNVRLKFSSLISIIKYLNDPQVHTFSNGHFIIPDGQFDNLIKKIKNEPGVIQAAKISINDINNIFKRHSLERSKFKSSISNSSQNIGLIQKWKTFKQNYLWGGKKTRKHQKNTKIQKYKKYKKYKNTKIQKIQKIQKYKNTKKTKKNIRNTKKQRLTKK